MKIVAIASGKGGVGKTTITGTLGHMLAVIGKKALIVDCNMTTPHLGLSIGLHDSHVTFNNVIKGKAHITDALYNHTSGFGVIPSSIKFKDLDGVDISRIKDIIRKEYKEFFSEYDIVLLDCAPGLGREAFAGIRSADEAILIATPHLTSVMDVIKCNDALSDLGIKPLGIAVNMIRGHKTELTKDYIESLTNLQVISAIPMDNHVLHSLAHRVPVSLYKPKSKASKSIYNIIYHLVTDEK